MASVSGLQRILCSRSLIHMKQAEPKADTAWRKSRLAARLLLRKETRPLRPSEQMLARLSRDSEVTNRLIQQALYYLGIGPRKHDFDQKLVTQLKKLFC